MNKAEKTAESYSNNCNEFANEFNSSGARTKDIDLAFSLNKSGSDSVLEVGCGNGRDAQYITKLTNSYTGIDPSEKFIELTRNNVSHGTFLVKFAQNLEFKPDSFGLVFAFASLLHLKKEDFKELMGKVYLWLKPGGVFYISLKKGEYRELEKVGKYGETRYFYFYEFKDILDIKGDLELVFHEEKHFKDDTWLEVILIKPI